ncbi:mitochondrial uncoupling protein 4 [Drosophila erecta]|uniref:CG18418-PA n=1 Tax=Drosophila erecta TaxID=7220 RepID=B3N5A0_DROER|nr:mitochondrial uncoupling protein 4 [Drosophila erecta]EDV57930.1 uncharacterized protein Dere_GG25109 [Drosophila erecta]
MGKSVNTVFRPAEWDNSEEQETPKLEYLVTNKKTPPVELYLTAFASACSAEIVGYPFDVCKTRMQIQGEIASRVGQKARYRGLLATAMGIVREEGLLKLYGGISAMLFRHSLFSGIKMLTYDYMREKMIVPDADGRPQLSFLGSCISGVVAGATASVLTNPTELIKIQMQMEGQRRLRGEPPRIHNVLQALTSIYRTGGVAGLWKGTVPNTWRSALVTIGDVSCYDLCKRMLIAEFDLVDNREVQFVAAMTAGVADAILSLPADVVKSRIMNQPTDEQGRGLHYKGSLDCLSRLVREEGFLAMYKGFLPYWMRVGPASVVFWMTFEQIRHFRGSEGY